ncbi:MAG TPA: hypothetical protein VD886_24375 [Herpetosiphonaceae bacterium]|nr:hypothetical protein [Herpetosiphonaceae bacterium]
MSKRTILAGLLALAILAGCDTTGSAPTTVPGFSDPPTPAAATTQQPGDQVVGTTYPVGEPVPPVDPNAVVTYPTPGADTQPPAAPVTYPTP